MYVDPNSKSSFLWGAATSAFQIEGGTAEGGRGPSIWDDFSRRPGAIRNGETADVACDHFHRWNQDLDLAAWIGLDSYRLSVSWSRLQPAGSGPLNPAGVEFYRSVLAGCRARGIRPFVTLYHWDLPSPLEDAGGWPERETAYRFAEYAGLTADAMSDLVGDFVTLNEPWCSSFLGYYKGAHAPGRTDLHDAVRAAHHLNLAHGLSVHSLRNSAPGASIGISNLVTDIVAATDGDDDRAAAARVDANANQMFLSPVYTGEYAGAVHDLYDDFGLRDVIQPGDLDLIATPTDFAGVNHYHRNIVSADPDDPHLGAIIDHAPPTPTTLGWSFLPTSLSNVLARVGAESGLPLYATENGAAFNDVVGDDGSIDDVERTDYFAAYTAEVMSAVADGIDVRGYFAWSLLDNFEWAEGYSQRFGLIHVDYSTQRRIPKSSALWYRNHITEHRSRRTSSHSKHTAIPRTKKGNQS
jgi:beta-glucosidase